MKLYSAPRNKLTRAIAIATGSLIMLPAFGQNLEEIVVTATKREQSLQDVPISVNVVTGAKMEEAGIDRIEDLQDYVPNLVMSETGIGNNIYIRGIGSGINPGFEQSAASFVDGVHYGRGQLYRAPIFDMERVEVLRGPQSILFGKNSIAGAISISTAKPTSEKEGYVSALYEPDHEETELTLVASGPLGDSTAGRIAIRKRDMDGYIENIFLGEEETDRDELTVRGTLVWEASENLEVTAKYERNEFDIVGRQVEIIDDVYGFAAPIPTNPIGVPYSQLLVLAFGQDPSVAEVEQDYRRSSNGDFSNNESNNFTLTLDYEWGDFTLTSITAYLDYEFEELCDCDFGSAIVIDAPLAEEYDQFSQELRLTSPGGEKVDWILGAFFQTNEHDSPDETGVPANSILGPVVGSLLGNPAIAGLFNGTGAARSFNQETDSFSVFGQATWNVSEDFRFIFGGRYTDEDKEAFRRVTLNEFQGPEITPATDPLRWGTAAAVYAGLFGIQVIGHDISGSRNDSSFDVALTGQWDVGDNDMLYASFSTGFKAGGFDTRSNTLPGASAFGVPGVIAPGTLPDGSFEFEDEEATSFEVGGKFGLADGAAELNVALFYTEYDNLQISIFDGILGFNVGNAAEAEIQGLELDGRWQLSDNWSMFGNLAITDFEFVDFQNGQCYFGEPDPEGDRLCDRTGETNQYVADYQGALGFSYDNRVGDNLNFRADFDVTFTDDFFTAQNNDPVTIQDSYAKLNVRLALANANDSWELALLGRNLTDEDVVRYTNPVPLSGTFGSNSHYGFVERPRSVAVQASWRW
ncbi:MAG: TonB-dependent receptor [Xanthomonadales bacterium]|nr:TonB-dependent receptor [Xanthomonadales bacterium]